MKQKNILDITLLKVHVKVLTDEEILIVENGYSLLSSSTIIAAYLSKPGKKYLCLYINPSILIKKTA